MRIALPLLAVALSGCLTGFSNVPDDFSWDDADLDGIPDAFEERIAADCWVHDRTCKELGIEPPTVGVRDLIVVELSHSGHDARLDDASWAALETELDAVGIRFQRADLGTRDDLSSDDQYAETSDFFAGFAWFLSVAHEPEHPDHLGYQEGIWIGLADPGPRASQTATLLHEVYHALLGPLDEAHSACEDEEFGGVTHSGDDTSVLYVDADCEPVERPASLAFTAAERREVTARPIDALWVHNHACWWGQGEVAGTPCA